MKENETINIAMICDDNYVICTGVAIYSLYINRNPNRYYNINIICNDVTKEKIDLLLELGSPNFDVNVIDVSSNRINYANFSKMKFAKHVSTTALYKFNLTEIFSDLNKILYLDGDLLIRDSLENLYDIELDSKYAAVCKDMGAETFPSQFNERLNIQHNAYFNSGVMLLNLKLLRNDNISKKLIDYKIQGINHFMDQDAFNVVFEENVIYFDFLYNMALSCWLSNDCESLSNYYDLNFEIIEEFYYKCKILHFSAYYSKPWLYKTNLFDMEWLSYFFKSPFKYIAIDRKSNSFNKFSRALIIENIKFDYILVSVIIPVYNSERYLECCIESLLNQTIYACEFIFINDGSSDNSIKILHEYSKIDSRIVIIDKKNEGAGVARNIGLDIAKGEYVSFLDSDDIMIPNALELMLKKSLKTNADIVVANAYTFSTNYDERKASGWCIKKEFKPNGETYSINNFAHYIFQVASGVPWARLFKNSFIKKYSISFAEITKSEDLFFVFLAYALAEKIAVLDIPLVAYRSIEGNGSLEDNKDSQPTAFLDCYRLIFNRFIELNIYDKVKQSFCNALVGSYQYHFSTFKTGAAFEQLYNTLETEFKFYDIDIADVSFFFDAYKHNYVKQIFDSQSCLEYLFEKNKKILKSKDKIKYINTNNISNDKRYNKTNGQLRWARGELKKVRSDRLALRKEVAGLRGVKSTLSYQLGMFITWLPRKIRNFFIG